jgi:hypothetical protein
MLEGLPDGQVRIWAVAEGYLANYSAPVEVQAGEERYGLEMRLDPIPPENHISVAVVDPEGAPVPRALLEYRHKSESTGTSASGDQEADANGRYVFIVPDGALLWITAQDPELRYGPSSAAAVRTNADTIVLRLEAVGSFGLSVHGEDGEPIERFGFALLSPDGDFEYQSAARAPHAQGRVDVRRPSDDFMVEIDAPSHALMRAGPFTPADLGAENGIDLVLARPDGHRGRCERRDSYLGARREESHCASGLAELGLRALADAAGDRGSQGRRNDRPAPLTCSVVSAEGGVSAATNDACHSSCESPSAGISQRKSSSSRRRRARASDASPSPWVT